MYKGFISGVLFFLLGQTLFNGKEMPTGVHTKRLKPFSPKILRGTDAIPGEFPWLVRLKIYLDKKAHAGCGGSIISKWHVLTAAHCCEDIHQEFRKIVLAGEFNLKKDPDCDTTVSPKVCLPRVQKFTIDDYLMHEKYTIGDDEALHDICVVRLNAPIQFNDYVYAANLPYDWKDCNWAVGTPVTVAGWGLLQRLPEKKTTKILKKANIQVRPCKFKNPDSKFYTNEETIICAGDASRKDVCSGDSGGPLMYKDEQSKKTIVIGTVAKGEVCTFDDPPNDDPGMYTRVDKYLRWIEGAMEKLKPPSN